MSTLFPERQAAVKVLYKAAGQLLDSAVDTDITCTRELNRRHAERCLELAEKIAKMGKVIIHVDGGKITQVDGIPFDLGYGIDDDDKS